MKGNTYEQTNYKTVHTVFIIVKDNRGVWDFLLTIWFEKQKVYLNLQKTQIILYIFNILLEVIFY